MKAIITLLLSEVGTTNKSTNINNNAVADIGSIGSMVLKKIHTYIHAYMHTYIHRPTYIQTYTNIT